MIVRKPAMREAFGAGVIIAAPVLFAISQARSSPARDRLELFSLSWSNLLPLLFPLLIAVVFLHGISDELSNGGTRAVRTRIPLRKFLMGRIVGVAGLTFVVFAVAVIFSWLFAYVLTEDQLGSLIAPPEPGETYSDPSERHRFTELLGVHPVAFGAFYAAWVGINAAAYAALGVAALIWVHNRFVALAVPFIVYLGLTMAPAVIRLESYSSSMAIFPFSLVQVPAWQSLPQLVAVVLITVVALVLAAGRDYDTPELD